MAAQIGHSSHAIATAQHKANENKHDGEVDRKVRFKIKHNRVIKP